MEQPENQLVAMYCNNESASFVTMKYYKKYYYNKKCYSAAAYDHKQIKY